MKKHFLFLIALLFLLSGCSQNKSEEISVNNPYDVLYGSELK
jgi:outer membrane protein assembly factor BamD (BamD/ComL family)